MTLAVVILTKNEEINIVDVIKNARQCTDEILKFFPTAPQFLAESFFIYKIFSAV